MTSGQQDLERSARGREELADIVGIRGYDGVASTEGADHHGSIDDVRGAGPGEKFSYRFGFSPIEHVEFAAREQPNEPHGIVAAPSLRERGRRQTDDAGQRMAGKAAAPG